MAKQYSPEARQLMRTAIKHQLSVWEALRDLENLFGYDELEVETLEFICVGIDDVYGTAIPDTAIDSYLTTLLGDEDSEQGDEDAGD